MIQGVSHVAICVPDLEKARDFYRDMFGFEVWQEESWEAPNDEYDHGVGLRNSAARGYIMTGSNCYLELWQYESPQPLGNPLEKGANDYGIRHIAFEVDNVEQEFARLEKLGGIVMNRPVRKGRQSLTIYCRDPFGNIVELMEAGEFFPSLKDLPVKGGEQMFEDEDHFREGNVD